MLYVSSRPWRRCGLVPWSAAGQAALAARVPPVCDAEWFRLRHSRTERSGQLDGTRLIYASPVMELMLCGGRVVAWRSGPCNHDQQEIKTGIGRWHCADGVGGVPPRPRRFSNPLPLLPTPLETSGCIHQTNDSHRGPFLSKVSGSDKVLTYRLHEPRHGNGLSLRWWICRRPLIAVRTVFAK